ASGRCGSCRRRCRRTPRARCRRETRPRSPGRRAAGKIKDRLTGGMRWISHIIPSTSKKRYQKVSA
ncbi:hypothetical protein FGG08_005120, partial [Glutinoglossum americanum]